nr:MAG TPA: hypothetical protein [Caudoviricetes sp.]
MCCSCVPGNWDSASISRKVIILSAFIIAHVEQKDNKLQQKSHCTKQ